MRRVNDFAEKRVNSVDARSPVAESSRTTYRCSSPGAEEDSVCAEITFHSARETVATSVKRIAALSFRTVLVDQSLKARIGAERIPNRIYLKTLHGDSARSAQQSIQNFDYASVVAKNGVNFGHPSRNFRAAEGVLAFRLQFGRALRLRQRGVLFVEVGEHFCQLNVRLRGVGVPFQLLLDGAFCP